MLAAATSTRATLATSIARLPLTIGHEVGYRTPPSGCASLPYVRYATSQPHRLVIASVTVITALFLYLLPTHYQTA